jgi:dihydroflavonol-4-reductase
VKALVIGATGHIGNAVTRELLGRGYEVTASGRRAQAPENLRGLRVRYVAGDAEAPGAIERLIEGHDLLVDAAAPYPSLMAAGSGAADPVEQARRRTQTIIDAVGRRRARLAYVSSFTTLPERSAGFERVQREWVRRSHPYFAVKREIETAILEAGRAGLAAAIVNPTLCLGPWDLKPRENCFVPRLLSGEAPVTVAHVVNVIDVRDVAAGLAAVLEAERYGEAIPLTGHNLSLESLYRWLCEIGGVAAPRLVAPMTLTAIASYWSEVALGAVGMRPPLPAIVPLLMMLHDSFDTGRVQAELGITPRALSGTLRDAIEWYRQIGYC